MAEGETSNQLPNREIDQESFYSNPLTEVAAFIEGLFWTVSLIAILVGLSILLSMVGMAVYVLVNYG